MTYFLVPKLNFGTRKPTTTIFPGSKYPGSKVKLWNQGTRKVAMRTFKNVLVGFLFLIFTAKLGLKS